MIDLRHGDCLEVLKNIPDNSVHCCVTSPPYWGLRDYSVTPSVCGGDPTCAHEWGDEGAARRSSPHVGLSFTGNGSPETRAPGLAAMTAGEKRTGAFCSKCGAWRGCLGLEPRPDLYVANMVAVFHDVRRVLRPDGTLWLNLGDSYASGGRGKGGVKQQTNFGSAMPAKKAPTGLKQKDLVGIPWRVAFALQADGWYLRSDIIWNKPNPMPESVRDRPTKAHEYIFMLSKSARYFWDQRAVLEKHSRDLWNESCGHEYMTPTDGRNDGGARKGNGNPEGRNIRSVWTIASQPFSGAHFACMPPKLAEICIKAGCPVGGTVLDPFSGAGTTLVVADRLQRNAIGAELNKAYVEMSYKRIADDNPLFAAVDAQA